jgi:hypothetical protein
MQKVFMIAGLISILFCFFKFLEMKYLEKEWKPLKFVIRDAVVVFLCSTIGLFVYANINTSLTDFMNVVTDNKTSNMAATQIFTDEPGF